MDSGDDTQADLAPLWGDGVWAYVHGREALTTSEQMFFRGSPLDHVLKYEQELRHRRQARTPHLGQARRILC